MDLSREKMIPKFITAYYSFYCISPFCYHLFINTAYLFCFDLFFPFLPEVFLLLLLIFLTVFVVQNSPCNLRKFA